MVVADVALVVDFDEQVAIAAFLQPSRGVVHRMTALSRPANISLSEVEVTKDDDHPEFVLVEDAFEPRHVIRAQ